MLTDLEVVYINQAEYNSLDIQRAMVLGVVLHSPAVEVPAPWPQVKSGLSALSENCVELFLAKEKVEYCNYGDISISRAGAVLFGSVSVQAGVPFSPMLPAQGLYERILDAIKVMGYPYLLRMWNVVPGINQSSNSEERYKLFCEGRLNGFSSNKLRSEDYPAASAVGSHQDDLAVYFFAGRNKGQPLENPRQVSAYNYPRQYGKRPPSFARAMINVRSDSGPAQLYVSGTSSIIGHESLYLNDVNGQIRQTMNNIHTLVAAAEKQTGKTFIISRENARFKVYIRRKDDFPTIRKIMEQELGASVTVQYLEADICRRELLVEVEGIIRSEENGDKAHAEYKMKSGRIRTRSLEAHIVDHCNLRCEGCCSLSPFLPEYFMAPEELEHDVQLAKSVIAPDCFKVAGGEPLLHPRIVECLEVIKKAGIAEKLSVTTNGFLIKKMPDSFWEVINGLTVSLYPDPALPEDIIQYIRSKAELNDVDLNMKDQREFVDMTRDEPVADYQTNSRIYGNCWLKERCHIISRGRFYMCTRPVHFETYFRGKVDFRGDGILLSDRPGLRQEIMDYLNKKDPLKGCSFCRGGFAPTKPHQIMDRSDETKSIRSQA